MTKVSAAAFWLITMMILNACSKNVTPQPDPVVPPVDSTHLPDKGDGKDGGDTGGDQTGPITKTYEFINLPVMDAATANSLFLGAITAKTNMEALRSPEFITVEDALRNPVTLYTDLALDVDPLKNVIPSEATDRLILRNIRQAFDQGVDQLPRVRFSAVTAFEQRYNSLRSMVGINEDMNALFDLGFADTSRLQENKGRVVVSFEVIKANITVQPPIYGPFLSIDSTDQQWMDLFGSQKAPEMLSTLIYGESAVMVMESDSSTEKLKKVVGKCLNAPLDKILSGQVFTALNAEEQDIISGASSYGFSVDGGSFPHTGKEAIVHYAALGEKAVDLHEPGRLLYYRLSNIQSFETFVNKFDVAVYTQKTRK